VGEAFGGGNVAFGNAAIVEKVLKPMVMGRDPREIALFWHEIYNMLRDHGQKGMSVQAMSGLDIALWDILGKSTGLPLYRLLGGPFRTCFKSYGYGMMFRKVPDLAAFFEKEAASIRGMGFTATKMKMGMGVAMDIELATAVRRGAGEGFKAMTDANHAYMAGEAIQLGLALRDLGFYWFEEPVAPEDYEGYREVKAALPGIHIAGGEAEFTRYGFRELLSRRCVSIVQPEVCGLGGISEFQKVAALASAFGIPVIPTCGARPWRWPPTCTSLPRCPMRRAVCTSSSRCSNTTPRPTTSASN
jgi:D-galactarolactone cycloisomerase